LVVFYPFYYSSIKEQFCSSLKKIPNLFSYHHFFISSNYKNSNLAVLFGNESR